jgi:peroxiredoxin family protein
LTVKTITVADKIKQMDARLKALERSLEKGDGQTKMTGDPANYRALLTQWKALEGKVNAGSKENKLTLVVFSGELDKVVTAFILGTSAVAMGMEVVMFFSFWGTAALRKIAKTRGKSFLQKMFGFLLPRDSGKLRTSHLNLGGMGPNLFRRMMKNGGVASLEELVQIAMDQGIKIIVCEMSRELLGIQDEELIGKFETAGAAVVLNEAYTSSITLFI